METTRAPKLQNRIIIVDSRVRLLTWRKKKKQFEVQYSVTHEMCVIKSYEDRDNWQ
jgi:hypothetical protein